MAQYRELLNAGDTRGAFACMVKKAGYAPRPLTVMPLWYVRAILRLVIGVRQWKKMEPLLAENLAEHEQVDSIGTAAERYAAISSRVLLLGGKKPSVYQQRPAGCFRCSNSRSHRPYRSGSGSPRARRRPRCRRASDTSVLAALASIFWSQGSRGQRVGLASHGHTTGK